MTSADKGETGSASAASAGTGAAKASAPATAKHSKSSGDHSGHSDGHGNGNGHGEGFWALTIGAIGVVFGDIGTSPLYAMREALMHTGHTLDTADIYGVTSLILWALIIVVTLKYVFFIMRVDNKGEGGILVLTTLAEQAFGKRSMLIVVAGMIGAALFYGDGMITPAISVLGAVEGLKLAPGIAESPEAAAALIEPFVLPITVAILVVLFLVQSFGTGAMAKYFGPITAMWFFALAGIGVHHILSAPQVLAALSPHYALAFLINNGMMGVTVLGSVFLAVTGAEALYADMGHFGKSPIKAGWMGLVLPSLALCYLGQASVAVRNIDTIRATHNVDGIEFFNLFYESVPEIMFWPVLILATLAAIIASQAVITGAFSLTQQAVQLGYLPRLEIRRTSETQAGQIFVPQINTLLLIGVLLLVFLFRSSSNLASAYGIAVTGTMLATTVLAFLVVRYAWKWSIPLALLVTGPLFVLETVFFAANLPKLPHGAWVPLAFAAVIVVMMMTWAKGSKILTEKTRRDSVPMKDLMDGLAHKPPHRVAGTAVFLTSDPDVAPVALMHNLKHNKVLHEANIILTVRTAQTPRVPEKDRLEVTSLNDDFRKIVITYGFMESPNIPRALALCRKQGLKFDIMSTSFFLGHRTIIPSPNSGMPLWQDKLFVALSKNAANATDFFHLPSGRVVELGTQVMV